MQKYFVLGLVNKEKDKIIYNKAFKKSENLMTKKDKNTVIIHNINGDYEVLLGETKIKFDENFHIQLEKIVWEALKLVKVTPTMHGLEEDNYIELKEGKISSAIYSLVTLWDYNKESIDVLDIAIDLLIRLCRGHLISNGNKRLALISCSIFLNSVGLYLKWSNEKRAYLNYWENLMVDIASGFYGSDLEEIKNNKEFNIKEKFLNSIMINDKWIYL